MTVVAGGSGVVVGAAEDGGGATVMGIGDFSRGGIAMAHHLAVRHK